MPPGDEVTVGLVAMFLDVRSVFFGARRCANVQGGKGRDAIIDMTRQNQVEPEVVVWSVTNQPKMSVGKWASFS